MSLSLLRSFARSVVVTAVAVASLIDTARGQGEDVAFYVPFDDSLEDVAGNHQLSESPGDVLYADAISNRGLRILPSLDSQGLAFRTSPDPGPGGFAVAFWFWYVQPPGSTVLANKGLELDSAPGWQIWMREVFDKPILSIRTGSSAGKIVERLISTADVELSGKWTHLAVAYDPDQGRIRAWINGDEGMFAEPTARSAYNVDASELRSNAPLQFALGRGALVIDEMAIWERALADEEVANLYARGLAGVSLREPAGAIVFAEPQQSNTLPVGASVTFSAVEPQPVQPIRERQWWKNGRRLPTTDRVHSIPFVDLNDDGEFVVASVSEANDVAVTTATLVVDPPDTPRTEDLTRPGGSTDRDLFGQSVALHDGFLAVTTPEANQVHLYRRTEGDAPWQHFQVLTKPDTADPPFGSKVVTDGQTVAVADGGLNLFIYEENTDIGQWVRVATENVGLGNNEALYLAVNDGVLVASDFSDNRAVVFERDATGTWNAAGVLRPGAGPERAGFGYLTKVSDGIIAISQGFEADVQTAIYLFEKLDGEWQRTQRIDAPMDGVTDTGTSLDIEGNRMAVGGRVRDPETNGVGNGSVWIYHRSESGQWEEAAQLALEGATPDVNSTRARIGIR